MQILLRLDWESKVSEKVKIYLLSVKDKEFVDQTFDKLYKLGGMLKSKNAIFLYSIFCVQKKPNGKPKRRVIVNIHRQNAITQLDVYLISIEADIIFVV